MADVFYVVTHLFVDLLAMPQFGVDFGYHNMLIAVISVAFMTLVHILEEQDRLPQLAINQPLWIRWSGYYALVFVIIIFGQFGTKEFFYFQF